MQCKPADLFPPETALSCHGLPPMVSDADDLQARLTTSMHGDDGDGDGDADDDDYDDVRI